MMYSGEHVGDLGAEILELEAKIDEERRLRMDAEKRILLIWEEVHAEREHRAKAEKERDHFKEESERIAGVANKYYEALGPVDQLQALLDEAGLKAYIREDSTLYASASCPAVETMLRATGRTVVVEEEKPKTCRERMMKTGIA